MLYFVVVYDRQKGKLLIPLEQYPEAERERALERRFELERMLGPDIEIVVLGAESEAAIRRTHGRYFYSPAELLSAGQAALEASARRN